MRRFSLRLAIPGLLLACSDGAGPDTFRACKAPVEVFVSHSVTPNVTWADGCRINELLIRTEGPLVGEIWRVFFPSNTNPMMPPIEFGVVPEGAQQTPGNPEPLQPGETYIIGVSISAPDQGGAIVRVGSTTLTP
jgi:hypothetical protein